MFVGSCNRPTPYFASSNGRGISTYLFDDETGTTELLSITPEIDNPTFLVVDGRGETLYANSEMSDWEEGTVTAYRIAPSDGTLSKIGVQETLGNTSAQLSLDRNGRYLLVANYGLDERSRQGLNKSVAVLPVDSGGVLGRPVSAAAHRGKVGPRSDRQECPHAHAVMVSPNNRFVLATDLGLDRLIVYGFEQTSGALTVHDSFAMPAGSGPRHFVFNRQGDRAYVVNELNSTVASLSFDLVTGQLSKLSIVRAVSSADAGHNHCSEIQLSPNGRHLFVANRGEDTLSRFSIGAAGETSEVEQCVPTGGKTPRHFAFDPTGKFIAVANQDSDRLSIFLSSGDGQLTPHQTIKEGTPMCVCFRRVD
jgi:6-phosphogluconolactonase